MKKFLIFIALVLMAAVSQAQTVKGMVSKDGYNAAGTNISNNELKTLDGATSNIQTQLNGTLKAADGVYGATKTVYVHNTNVPNSSGSTENTVLTFTIPGGQMGPNGYLKIYAHVSHTSNTNYKTVKVYINGTLIGTGSSNAQNGSGQRRLWTFINRNSVSSNCYADPTSGTGTGEFSSNLGSAAVFKTSSINTNVDMPGSVTLQTNGTDAMSLEYILIESVYMP